MTALSTGPRPIVRYAVTTRDPDAAHARICDTYTHFRVSRVRDPEQFEYRTRRADAGPLSLNHNTYRNGLEAEGDPVDSLAVLTYLGGPGTFGNGREEHRGEPGTSYLSIPGTPMYVRLHHPSALIPRLDYADVLAAAHALTGIEPGAFRFLSMRPASPALDAYWRATVGLVEVQLGGPNITHYYPLVAAETYNLLVCNVLQAFPNSTMTGLLPSGPGYVGPSVVRRAMEFIEANADRPVTLPQIAAAVQIGPRGLQHAFRRQADSTPMEYLRRVRLQRAHEELQRAEPTQGETVGAVAARHGFGNPGRFRRFYLLTYGRSPTETLAR